MRFENEKELEETIKTLVENKISFAVDFSNTGEIFVSAENNPYEVGKLVGLGVLSKPSKSRDVYFWKF